MKITTDVLIIGGGGAGLRAAIESADCGVSVLLVSKKDVRHAGATSYPIAEMAGYNAGDIRVPGDVEKHYNDIISAGQGMADEKLASILATKAPDTIKKLEEWGVKFEEVDDDYYVFRSCFSSHPRTHVIKGHGEPIVKAMYNQLSDKNNVKIMDDLTILGLAVADGRCLGAYGIRNDEIVYINAKSVVLATGGNGQAFERNMNPEDVTGDGYSMAYDAGAKLINMEFMQIGIGFSHPFKNIFNGYIWEGKPGLYDKDGKGIFESILPEGITSDDVMHKHRRHFPFSTSDNSKYIEIAVHKAIKEGRGTANRGITIDLRNMTDDYVNSLEDDCGISHMWPIARDYIKSRGLDLLEETAEIACFAHAINGGVLIDENAKTSIDGLYAAGECAGGPHGADRLGGNMMVTCQVFGEIAGRSAAQNAIRTTLEENLNLVASDKIQGDIKILYKDIDVDRLIHRLKVESQDKLLVNRTEEGLSNLLNIIAEIKDQILLAPEGRCINLKNSNLYCMLNTTGIMARSALARKESRGSHHRADYPHKDSKFNKPIIVEKS